MDRAPGWERRWKNVGAGYDGYRFQDFRSGCEYRDDTMGVCSSRCTHAAHPMAHDPEWAECLCDNCPLIEVDEGPDYNPYDIADGEQCVIVLVTPIVSPTGRAPGMRSNELNSPAPKAARSDA